MNQPCVDVFFSHRSVAADKKDTSVACQELSSITPMDDLIHDLRQPLEVIDSLAFYLQLTSSEPKVSEHAETIRAMVVRMNRMLEERFVC